MPAIQGQLQLLPWIFSLPANNLSTAPLWTLVIKCDFATNILSHFDQPLFVLHNFSSSSSRTLWTSSQRPIAHSTDYHLLRPQFATRMQPKNKGSHFIVLDSFNLLQAPRSGKVNPTLVKVATCTWPEAVCVHLWLHGPMHPPVAIYRLTVAHEAPIYMGLHAEQE